MVVWIVEGVVMFVILYTLVSVVILIVGVRFLERSGIRRKICESQMSKLVHTPLDVGISVVIYGYERLSEIDELLYFEYSSYEIVVVCDVETETDGRDFLTHYKMFRYEYVGTSELPCTGVRGVYRSRAKRYSKLVVVDKELCDEANAFNCATEIARYDNILFLDRYSTLRSDALNNFATVLSQYDSHYVYAVVALKEGEIPRNLFAKVCYYYTLLRDNVCTGAIRGVWKDERVTALFNRNSIISVGGFPTSENFELVMLRKIRESRKNMGRGFSMRSLYIGLPLVYTSSKKYSTLHTILDALYVMGALMLLGLPVLIIKHEWIMAVYLVMWLIAEIIIALLAVKEYGIVKK